MTKAVLKKIDAFYVDIRRAIAIVTDWRKEKGLSGFCEIENFSHLNDHFCFYRLNHHYTLQVPFQPLSLSLFPYWRRPPFC